MTTATSLILIATGAILAFAVSFAIAGIDIQAIGIILIVIGVLGLAISMATMAGYGPWGTGQTAVLATTPVISTPVASVTPVVAAPVAAVTPVTVVPPAPPTV